MLTTLTLFVSFAGLGTAADAAAGQGNPATQMALQLCLQRVELVEKQTLYQAEHPVLRQQQRHVRALEQSLQTVIDQGGQIDEKYLDAALDTLLRQAQAEVNVARQDLTDAHPRLALLELRLQSVAHVAVLRK